MPLISSGRYAGGQFPANADSEARYVPTAEPMSNEDRRREMYSKEYIPTQQIYPSKENRLYVQDVSKNRKFVNEDRSRIMGYYYHPTDAGVAKPWAEAAIKNGSEQTSCQVATFASPYAPTGDMLHRRHPHTSTALHKQAVCLSGERCENRKPRHDSARTPEYQLSPAKRIPSASRENRSRRQARADHLCPTPPSPPATTDSSRRQREARPSQRKSESTVETKNESMNVEAVEEEITCPM